MKDSKTVKTAIIIIVVVIVVCIAAYAVSMRERNRSRTEFAERIVSEGPSTETIEDLRRSIALYEKQKREGAFCEQKRKEAFP